MPLNGHVVFGSSFSRKGPGSRGGSGRGGCCGRFCSSSLLIEILPSTNKQSPHSMNLSFLRVEERSPKERGRFDEPLPESLATKTLARFITGCQSSPRLAGRSGIRFQPSCRTRGTARAGRENSARLADRGIAASGTVLPSNSLITSPDLSSRLVCRHDPIITTLHLPLPQTAGADAVFTPKNAGPPAPAAHPDAENEPDSRRSQYARCARSCAPHPGCLHVAREIRVALLRYRYY